MADYRRFHECVHVTNQGHEEYKGIVFKAMGICDPESYCALFAPEILVREKHDWNSNETKAIEEHIQETFKAALPVLAANLFDTIDTDGSGILDIEEYFALCKIRTAARMQGKELSQEQLEEATEFWTAEFKEKFPEGKVDKEQYVTTILEKEKGTEFPVESAFYLGGMTLTTQPDGVFHGDAHGGYTDSAMANMLRDEYSWLSDQEALTAALKAAGCELAHLQQQ
jgi:hypothetical protein